MIKTNVQIIKLIKIHVFVDKTKFNKTIVFYSNCTFNFKTVVPFSEASISTV